MRSWDLPVNAMTIDGEKINVLGASWREVESTAVMNRFARYGFSNSVSARIDLRTKRTIFISRKGLYDRDNIDKNGSTTIKMFAENVLKKEVGLHWRGRGRRLGCRNWRANKTGRMENASKRSGCYSCADFVSRVHTGRLHNIISCTADVKQIIIGQSWYFSGIFAYFVFFSCIREKRVYRFWNIYFFIIIFYLWVLKLYLN